jgi:hypothetical protein
MRNDSLFTVVFPCFFDALQVFRAGGGEKVFNEKLFFIRLKVIDGGYYTINPKYY